MRKSFVLAAFSAVIFAQPSFAGNINLNFTTETNGYRTSYHAYNGESPVYVDEATGVLSHNEAISFDWNVAYTDGPYVWPVGSMTIHTFTSSLTPGDMTLNAGLLTEGLTPGFVPTDEYVYSEINAGQQWNDYTDSAGTDRGFVSFVLSLAWVASFTDADNTTHMFNYTRAYSFSNASLLTSAADVGTYSQDLFEQLLINPLTERQFAESVAAWTYTYHEDGSYTNHEAWGYSLLGTFDLPSVQAVSEPTALGLLFAGALIAPLRLRRKYRA